MPSIRHIAWWKIGALVFTWVLVWGLAFAMNPPSFRAFLLKANRLDSAGKVTAAPDVVNHNNVTYSYSANGVHHTGIELAPEHRELRVGDEVRVEYFPRRPQIATIASRQEQNEALKGALVTGIILATIATAALWRVFFRRSRSVSEL